MTADTPSRSVPRLRFPAFQSQRGWPYTMLRAVLEEHGKNSDGASEVHSVSFAKGIVPQVEHMGRSYAASDTAHYSLVQPHDVVYTRSPLSAFPLGIVKQHKGFNNAIVSPLYGVFQPRNRYIGKIIEAYFDSSSRSITFLDPLAQKGAKNTIQLSNNRFLSGALYLPEDEEEQQKIADCLGSLDDLIVAEGRKLEALRQHKQALMQKLFPQEGETVPRLRFPEFKEAPDWKEERLGNIVTIVSGKSPSQYALFSQGNCAFVKVEDLNNCFKYQTDAREYCDDTRDAVPSGSILFPKRGAAIENNKIRITASEILIDTNLMALRPHDTAETEFIFYYIVCVGLAQIADTSSIPQINNKHIVSYRVLIPTDKLEQKRIGDCLSVLDDRIGIQARKLDTLKQHKQGLLQQLFPSLAGQ